MILDTNAVSALSFEDGDLLKLLENNLRHHLPVIVIGEYECGLVASKYREKLNAWFDLLISECIVLTVDRETTPHYASICSSLKRSGTPIPSNDLWIAALAKQFDLPIISRDQHFDKVAGIQRIGW